MSVASLVQSGKRGRIGEKRLSLVRNKGLLSPTRLSLIWSEVSQGCGGKLIEGTRYMYSLVSDSGIGVCYAPSIQIWIQSVNLDWSLVWILTIWIQNNSES